MNSHTHVHVFSFHLQIIELLVAVLRTRFVFCHIGTYLVSFIRNEFTHGQLVVSHGKCEMRFTLKQNLLLNHLLITFPVVTTTYLTLLRNQCFQLQAKTCAVLVFSLSLAIHLSHSLFLPFSLFHALNSEPDA